ncbi:glycosyltransferase family 2 protein [Magnetospirillum sulfuroxidans]|uniref:Glycosyltransferase n=1 Tax=Magnetospirillum sulfuroxidans TaxID=611300 RepID=A0ABS5IHR1_9PROT|nr:glycosyltransferase family 2 protein [Magnetospirillum sulfuroxidans]MBR9973894.1 glycosyltransferase [Magnetospirillum sulfuroxidans]
MKLSIVTPAYREARNLPLMYERLKTVCDGLNIQWEWVIVDDHSPDDTFAVTHELAERDARVRGMRLSRNFGSHAAISCGLAAALGDAAVIMAGDLQDPPETIPALMDHWRQGAQIVWAVRTKREGETVSTLAFSQLYYWLMRHVASLKDTPAMGADFFLMDRITMDSFAQFGERNVSIVALVQWMGFRQAHIEYVKEARLHGVSGWSLSKKIKLVIDSMTSFSYLPIRAMSAIGVGVALFGFLYALYILAAALVERAVPGYASLMVAVLILSGLQMVMLGVLGEYMWRNYDESRRRPRWLVESAVGRLPESGKPPQG